MNKEEFLRELARLLQNIPDSERIEALQYYEDYFNDAGPENEQKVLEELGTPRKVADTIKDGLLANMDCRETIGGQNTTAYQSTVGGQGATAYQSTVGGQGATAYQSTVGGQGATAYQSTVGGQNTATYQTPPVQKEEGIPAWAIVLIVIGCIFCSPVIIALAAVLFGLIVAVMSVMFALVIGFGVSCAATLFAGLVVTIMGLVHIIVSPFSGMIVTGVGLICFAVGILFMMITVFLCGCAIPAMCRGIAWICGKIFKRKQKI